MAPVEKILARGYETPEAAFAPLRAALPWMKTVAGEIALPKSTFMFRQGEGKKSIRCRVWVTAEKKDEGFAITLRMERIPTWELISFVSAMILFDCIVVYSGGVETLWLVAPFTLLVSVIWLRNRWTGAQKAFDAFSLPYEAGAIDHRSGIPAFSVDQPSISPQ